jgi:hypothetical protein
MSRCPLAALVATCLLMVGCGQADQPPSSGATAKPAAPPQSEAAGEQTLRTWVNALETGDGASGCAVTTPRFRDYFVQQAVALQYVPAGASCADAVAATGLARRDLGWSGRIERITRIEKFKNNRAYFEVAWLEK